MIFKYNFIMSDYEYFIAVFNYFIILFIHTAFIKNWIYNSIIGIVKAIFVIYNLEKFKLLLNILFNQRDD